MSSVKGYLRRHEIYMSEIKGNNGQSKPVVSILMAVYNPRMDWFAEQLQSINNQTYPNIKVLVRDDSSDKKEFIKIKECIFEKITRFPIEILCNAENKGSNKTFELLTAQADGDYLAYCDQDDIWLPEKIEKLVDFIQKTESQLVCSDVYVIDENGQLKADSITQIRKRHIFCEGENLTEQLLFRNFVLGCTMLIKASVAKESIPFIEDMVHDHYLALCAASRGRICVYKENLIKYRIHGKNQTSVLAGVCSKEDYYKIRILPYLRRMREINKRFDLPFAKEALKWAEARQEFYFKRISPRSLWKLRHCDKKITYFELILLNTPNFIFSKAVGYIQRGKI